MSSTSNISSEPKIIRPILEDGTILVASKPWSIPMVGSGADIVKSQDKKALSDDHAFKFHPDSGLIEEIPSKTNGREKDLTSGMMSQKGQKSYLHCGWDQTSLEGNLVHYWWGKGCLPSESPNGGYRFMSNGDGSISPKSNPEMVLGYGKVTSTPGANGRTGMILVKKSLSDANGKQQGTEVLIFKELKGYKSPNTNDNDKNYEKEQIISMTLSDGSFLVPGKVWSIPMVGSGADLIKGDKKKHKPDDYKIKINNETGVIEEINNVENRGSGKKSSDTTKSLLHCGWDQSSSVGNLIHFWWGKGTDKPNHGYKFIVNRNEGTISPQSSPELVIGFGKVTSCKGADGRIATILVKKGDSKAIVFKELLPTVAEDKKKKEDEEKAARKLKDDELAAAKKLKEDEAAAAQKIKDEEIAAKKLKDEKELEASMAAAAAASDAAIVEDAKKKQELVKAAEIARKKKEEEEKKKKMAQATLLKEKELKLSLSKKEKMPAPSPNTNKIGLSSGKKDVDGTESVEMPIPTNPWGKVYCLNGDISELGTRSIHFDNNNGSIFASFDNIISSESDSINTNSGVLTCDDGETPFPKRLTFHNCEWNQELRMFSGSLYYGKYFETEGGSLNRNTNVDPESENLQNSDDVVDPNQIEVATVEKVVPKSLKTIIRTIIDPMSTDSDRSKPDFDETLRFNHIYEDVFDLTFSEDFSCITAAIVTSYGRPGHSESYGMSGYKIDTKKFITKQKGFNYRGKCYRTPLGCDTVEDAEEQILLNKNNNSNNCISILGFSLDFGLLNGCRQRNSRKLVK